MDLIQALRTGLALRRPIAKHTGSNRSGYMGRSFVLELLTDPAGHWRHPSEMSTYRLIDETDLLATDWEVKNEQQD